MTPPSEPDSGAQPPDESQARPADEVSGGTPRRRGLLGRIARTLFWTGLLALLALGGGAYWGWTQFTGPGPLSEDRIVYIPPGSGLSAIADRLTSEGVLERQALFILGVRLSGAHAQLKAGEYAFGPRASQHDVLAVLRRGETVDRFVTVPEGLTSAEIVALLNEAPALEGRIEAVPPEGSILPETYHYERGQARADLMLRMQAALQAELERLWADRAPNLPFDSPREAVTLASIIEKETGVAGERAKVAGVFVNRLRRGMRLQSDPTVIYALTEGAGPLDRALTRRDWRVEHPYNTYRIDGLPPGPIANPGRAAIAAALDPAETDALYFVADGAGGHAFARTLEEHNRNVARWRRIRDGAD